MKLTIFTLFAFFLIQVPLSAKDNKKQDSSISPNFSKEEVLKQIEMLKKEGRISQADLDEAQKAMSMLQTSLANENSSSLPSISVSKEDILKTVEDLNKQGKISQTELDMAKKELSGLSDSQIQSMTKIAIDIIKQDPEKFLELMNSNKAKTDKTKMP